MNIVGEIMTAVRTSGVALIGNDVNVVRGAYGTAATAHGEGASVSTSNNSLKNQLRLPIGTSDGNTDLFTWDGYWTSSYLKTGLTNHKAFQFSSGKDGIWLEPQMRFDGGAGIAGGCTDWDPATQVAAIEMRSYNSAINGNPLWALTDGNQLGPGTTNKEPIQPKLGSFCVSANRWTRFWVRIEQRANDYDYMDMWAADEMLNPIQIYRHIPISIPTTGSANILKFWLEFNTSTSDYKRGNPRDLVAYVRNFVALLNPPSDVSPLLLRPSAGVPVATVGPKPPRNVRIIS
jgi:hypothetical protein